MKQVKKSNLNPAIECQYCKELRPLSVHLYELAQFCSYLDNTVDYIDGSSKRKVKSKVISDWLKLASQLEKVEIDAWKFEDITPHLYCEPLADEVDSNTSHFSDYSTALTRFIFVTNALEETYRFVAQNYEQLANSQCIPKNKRLKKASMQAAALIDSIPKQIFPKHFDHLVDNYVSLFNDYSKEYKTEISAFKDTLPRTSSYGLNIVRNIRNHVAHGVFPLIDNLEYFGARKGERDFLIQLLRYSCKLAAIFIQILIGKFNHGFESVEYQRCKAIDDKEFHYFITNCTNEYIANLHIEGEFSFIYAFYSNDDE